MGDKEKVKQLKELDTLFYRKKPLDKAEYIQQLKQIIHKAAILLNIKLTKQEMKGIQAVNTILERCYYLLEAVEPGAARATALSIVFDAPDIKQPDVQA